MWFVFLCRIYMKLGFVQLSNKALDNQKISCGTIRLYDCLFLIFFLLLLAEDRCFCSKMPISYFSCTTRQSTSICFVSHETPDFVQWRQLIGYHRFTIQSHWSPGHQISLGQDILIHTSSHIRSVVTLCSDSALDLQNIACFLRFQVHGSLQQRYNTLQLISCRLNNLSKLYQRSQQCGYECNLNLKILLLEHYIDIRIS